VHHDVGLLYKVVPTALVAAAVRPRMCQRELVDRLDHMIGLLAAGGANLAVRSGAKAADEGVALLSDRGVLQREGDRLRVRDRIVLRYYGRTIEHLLDRRRTTH
jgi:hypothetical protein